MSACAKIHDQAERGRDERLREEQCDSVSDVWSHADYCQALKDRADSFVAMLAGADLAGPVPTCPGWDIAQLIAHVGATHRWVTAMVAKGGFERVSYRIFAEAVPVESDARVPWLAEGAALLVQNLQASAPNQPVWVFGVEGVVAFWPRRMLHELTIHQFDLGRAIDRPITVEAAVAVDGIAEFFTLALGNPKLVTPQGLAGGTFVVALTDVDSTWLVHWDGDGIDAIPVSASGSGPASGSGSAAGWVRGTAVDVYTWLWNRGGTVHVAGDTDLIERWNATVRI